MPNYAVFFAGSDQRVTDPKHVYVDWAVDLAQHGYSAVLCDGVGKFGGTSGTTGAGWATIVQHAMTTVESGGSPDRVIVVGMSRGGVQAMIFAHCMRHQFPAAKLFVFAIDPVQGGHIQNDGSFDLRDNRNLARSLFGRRGSRDDLKDRYRLSDAAPNTVPANVEFYLTALMQFRGNTRKFWGFTPQAPRSTTSMGSASMHTPPMRFPVITASACTPAMRGRQASIRADTPGAASPVKCSQRTVESTDLAMSTLIIRSSPSTTTAGLPMKTSVAAKASPRPPATAF